VVTKATRFRFRKTKKGKQRLGFRNNVVVEVTTFTKGKKRTKKIKTKRRKK